MIAIAATLVGGSASGLAAQDVVQRDMRMTPEIEARIAEMQESRPEIIRVAPKQLNLGLLAERDIQRLRFSAFEDLVFEMERDQLRPAGRGLFHWVGQVEGGPEGEVFITVRDARLAYGSVRDGVHIVEIRPLEGNGHLIIEVDPTRLREAERDFTESDPEAPAGPAPRTEHDSSEGGVPSDLPIDTMESGAPLMHANPQKSRTAGASGPGVGTVFDASPAADMGEPAGDADRSPIAPSSASNPYPFINVLVAYTDDVESAVTDVETFATHAIGFVNQSYVNSGVRQRLHLVGILDTEYDEGSASMRQLRNRLRKPKDGDLDDVHEDRNETKADLVALLIDGGSGLAYIMNPVDQDFESHGFSVTDQGQVDYTLGHELGHNMGARHDRAVDNTDGKPFDYNHGYIEPGDSWRTKMAYPDSCGTCTRLNRWSNPDQSRGGDDMGVETTDVKAADNRRTLNTTSWTVSRFRMLGMNERADRFGNSLATGDFDGDGLLDLAVGAPGEAPAGAPQSGAVFVFHGTAFGLAPWGALSQSALGANENGDRFGTSLATGDFDHDGFDDLAVGAPGEAPGPDPKSGHVFIFRGTGSGLDPSGGVNQAGVGANEKGDRFGAALAVGDFDGDGFDDLAVGTPGEAPGSDPQSGNIFTFRGSSSGLQGWDGHNQDGMGANEAGDQFGSALASGDFDGDGIDDLAVGAPGEAPGPDPRAGSIFTFQGTSSGLQAWEGHNQDGMGANESGDGFGTALAAGDFDGDGIDDLAVGTPQEAPGSDPASGTIFTFQGTTSGLQAWDGYNQSGIGANEAGDYFGVALASADFDGDGIDDLAVGAPGEEPGSDPKAGYFFVFRGSGSGLQAWDGYGQGAIGMHENGDGLGSALAAGDFDGDGRADLAVGAPGEAPGDDPVSGHVFTYKGAATALGAWRGLEQEY